jgi:hypothetical protein
VDLVVIVPAPDGDGRVRRVDGHAMGDLAAEVDESHASLLSDGAHPDQAISLPKPGASEQSSLDNLIRCWRDERSMQKRAQGHTGQGTQGGQTMSLSLVAINHLALTVAELELAHTPAQGWTQR